MSSHLYILQLLPTMVGSRVRISASSCNIGIRDANCWFDSSVLVRKFQLDLSNPFERAVALLVLFLIASHQTYVIGLSEYYDPDARSTTNLGMRCCVSVDCVWAMWVLLTGLQRFGGSQCPDVRSSTLFAV
jgi:hypothetical protein